MAQDIFKVFTCGCLSTAYGTFNYWTNPRSTVFFEKFM